MSGIEENLKSYKKRKKYNWVVVTAMVVGTIVGSGIVSDSVLWTAAGGSYALFGVLFVWMAFFFVSVAMCDNVSMMPEKGGAYIWARRTMGRFWGVQVGWIYLIGYTCLSVILSWIAYLNLLGAVLYFFPQQGAFIAANVFSIVIPLLFMVLFIFSYGFGVKPTVQFIVLFFTVKITMWLTIVGIGLLHFDPSTAQNNADLVPLDSMLAVASLSVFAMLGLDSASIAVDDIHKPGKNFLKGTVSGMFLVLALYLSTIIMIMGLTGQSGASDYTSSGITGIFLELLSVPPPVLYVFIIISIIGTLYITMYLVVRLAGAMSENNDFYYSEHTNRHMKEQKNLTGLYKIEMPKSALFVQVLIYAAFFWLIYAESYFGTSFVLYCVYYLGVISILVILFFISLTNFIAHRKGIGKQRRKEKKEFRWARGLFVPMIGILSTAFVIGLSLYFMWTAPAFPLPGPDDSYAWEFWLWLGRIFPIFMFVPGILYWAINPKIRKRIKKKAPKKSKKE